MLSNLWSTNPTINVLFVIAVTVLAASIVLLVVGIVNIVRGAPPKHRRTLRRWLAAQYHYRMGALDLAFGQDALRIFGHHPIKSGLTMFLRGPTSQRLTRRALRSEGDE